MWFKAVKPWNESGLRLFRDASCALALFSFLFFMSPSAACLAKGYLLLNNSKSKTLGPGRLCRLQCGVTGFSGRGGAGMVRNVAVRKSREESL